jgi:hypothetical protein
MAGPEREVGSVIWPLGGRRATPGRRWFHPQYMSEMSDHAPLRGRQRETQKNREKKKKRRAIPVQIVDAHGHVLYAVQRSIGSGRLPLHNTLLLHVDAHPDLLLPEGITPQTVRGGDKVFLSSLLFSFLSLSFSLSQLITEAHSPAHCTPLLNTM